MTSWCPCFARLCHLLAIVYLVQAARNYAGHKVIRMVPKTHTHLKVLRTLRSTDMELDFWTEPSALHAQVDVRVPPENFDELTNTLMERSIDHSVFIDDVQEAIDRQQDTYETNEVDDERDKKPLLDFTKYHRLEKIHRYLYNLSLVYPDIVQVKPIGKSYEGRYLPVIKIGRKSNKCKPAIWIDAGIHAREWIAPATALYIVDQLTNQYEKNSNFVDNVDWYILPVANPDGYEFTHTEDRFWRKTRSPTRKPRCVGVDANRNFDFHYNEGGSSKFPCSEIYRGPKASSEPEVKAISEFLMEHSTQLKMYMSLHAYGQVILTPWGYTYELPSDFDSIYDLAESATQDLTAVNGTKYTIGSASHMMYVASGSSADFAKGMAGIKYAYGMELRDTGEHGFLLPANQIIQTGQETWEAFKHFAQVISKMSSLC